MGGETDHGYQKVQVRWGEVTCLQTHHSSSGAREPAVGQACFPDTKTLPLSAPLPFFTVQSGTCQVVLLLPVSCGPVLVHPTVPGHPIPPSTLGHRHCSSWHGADPD